MIKTVDIDPVETRERSRIFGPAIFAVIVGFIIAFQFTDERHEKISSFGPNGDFHALRYSRIAVG